MLDGLPELLYIAFAFAAAFLCYRWWYVGQILDKPCWGLYLCHLPFASLVWSMHLWDTARWVSVLGNLGLIGCAFEAARACGWWIIPPRERRWALVWASGVGTLLGACYSGYVTVPADQPAEYFIPGVFSQTAVIGIISAAWVYQRIRMDRHVNNSKNAWHTTLLLMYCLVSVFNFATPLPDSDPWFWPKIYITVTIRIGLFITWWFKAAPLDHRHALPA